MSEVKNVNDFFKLVKIDYHFGRHFNKWTYEQIIDEINKDVNTIDRHVNVIFGQKWNFLTSYPDFTETISKGDNVYFMKGVTFPRDKFRMWGEENDVVIRRSEKLANKYVFDKNIHTRFIRCCQDLLIVELEDPRCNKKIFRAATYMSADYFDRLLKDVNSRRSITGGPVKVLRALAVKEPANEYQFNRNEYLGYSLFLDKLFKGNNKFVDVKYLVENCHNQVVMDYNKYCSLWDLAYTGNRTSIDMVLKALSGIDVQRSLGYMASLYYRFYNVFKNHNAFQSVRVKSLREFMDQTFAGKRTWKIMNSIDKNLALLEAIKACNTLDENVKNKITFNVPPAVFAEAMKESIRQELYSTFSKIKNYDIIDSIVCDVNIKLKNEHKHFLSEDENIEIPELEVYKNT